MSNLASFTFRHTFLPDAPMTNDWVALAAICNIVYGHRSILETEKSNNVAFGTPVASRPILCQYLLGRKHFPRPHITHGKHAGYGSVITSMIIYEMVLLIPPLCCIYASVNWVSIDSGNGLSPVRRQALTWINADLQSIGPLETNFSENRIEIQNF